MSRWGEAFAALSRPNDTMDTVDTVEAAPPPPAIVSHSVNSVMARRGGGGEAGPLRGEQPSVVHMPANDPKSVAASRPAALCPACGSGRWWRTSAFPAGIARGRWCCTACSPPPSNTWMDAYHMPIAGP